MNKMQSKNHKIVTYKIKNISLLCFDDKIYFLNNGYDELPLGSQSLLWEKLYNKKSYLNNYLQQLFCNAIKILF